MTTMLSGFRGLNVDLTLTVINNTLGKFLIPCKKKKGDIATPPPFSSDCFLFPLKQSRYLRSLLPPQSHGSFASPQLIPQKEKAETPPSQVPEY